MLRARIEGEGAVGEERLGTDLDWLGATTSIETLAAHAAAAGRDWSFGWIRLAEDADPNDFARSLPRLRLNPLIALSGHSAKSANPPPLPGTRRYCVLTIPGRNYRIPLTPRPWT